MTTRIFTIAASSLAVILSSCYPLKETPTKPVPKKLTPEEIQAKKDAELKAEEEKRRKEQEEALNNGEVKIDNTTTDTTTTTDPITPEPPVRRDFPFANKVPGKDGFVFSPYNNKVVDVRGIPSGTLVQDPTYPAAEKKYFRVP